MEVVALALRPRLQIDVESMALHKRLSPLPACFCHRLSVRIISTCSAALSSSHLCPLHPRAAVHPPPLPPHVTPPTPPTLGQTKPRGGYFHFGGSPERFFCARQDSPQTMRLEKSKLNNGVCGFFLLGISQHLQSHLIDWTPCLRLVTPISSLAEGFTYFFHPRVVNAYMVLN